jgi:hypothetical protein
MRAALVTTAARQYQIVLPKLIGQLFNLERAAHGAGLCEPTAANVHPVRRCFDYCMGASQRGDLGYFLKLIAQLTGIVIVAVPVWGRKASGPPFDVGSNGVGLTGNANR